MTRSGTAWLVDHPAAWAAARASATPEDCAITSRLEVLFAARGEPSNLSCHHLWDGLSSATLKANEDAAWRCCADAAAHGAGVADDGGVSILALMQNDFALPLWRLFNLHDMVQAWFSGGAPARIAWFDGPVYVPYWTDSGDTSPLLTAVVRAAARRGGIELLRHPHPGSPAALPGPVERRATSATGEVIEGALEVISYCAFMGWPEQEALIELVAARGDTGWLLMADGRAVPPLYAAHYQDWLELPMRCDFADLTPERLQRHFCAAAPPRFRPLLESAELGFVWEQFRNWLWTGARWRRLGRLLAAAYRPRVFLSGGESGKGGAWCLNDGFSAEGAQVISVAHSGMGYTSLKRWMSGYRGELLAWGEEDARALRAWVDPAANLRSTGSMRKDLAYMTDCSARSAPGRVRSGPPTVILFTQRVGDDAVAWAHPSRHAALWERLLEVCRDLSDVQFIIKGHPRYDYWALYAGAAFRALPNVSLSRSAARELLAVADLAVLVNSPSTVSLDAMAMAVPVLYVKDDDPDGRDALIEQGGVEVVAGPEGLGAAIRRLLQDESGRAACVVRQTAFLQRALAHTGADSVAAADREIQQALRDGSTDDRPVDRGAQALTEFFRALGSAVEGGLSVDAFARRARLLRPAWTDPGERVEALLDRRRLGSYALHLACWRSAVARGVPATRLLLVVYRSLPRPVRPSPRVLLRYLKESLARDARERRADRAPAVETP